MLTCTHVLIMTLICSINDPWHRGLWLINHGDESEDGVDETDVPLHYVVEPNILTQTSCLPVNVCMYYYYENQDAEK